MNTESIDGGLLFEGRLPLSFHSISCFPDKDELMLINEKNENILKAAVSLHESIDVDDHDEVSLELKKLDQKLNLLLDMIGELLTQKNEFPPNVSIKLKPHSLVCENKELAQIVKNETTKKVKIYLYINPSIPTALNLYGKLKCAGNTGSELEADVLSPNMVMVEFYGLSQAVKDQLEKIIFRHHRKIIAQGRAIKDS